MNKVEIIQTNLFGGYFAQCGYLSRGNMPHFQASGKSLDFAPLMFATARKTTSVSDILLPLNNADSNADPHFF